MILGFLLTAAYIPAWTGAAILSGWIVLSCLLPFYLTHRLEMGLGHWLGLIFLSYATLGLLWAPVWQQGIWDLWLLWCLAFSFCLGQRDLKPLWIGMAIGLIVPIGFAWAQWFGYNPVFANSYGAYPGTYVNPDMLGETACLVTIALLTCRVYWPLLLTLQPIYLTQSRSVYVAYAAIIAFYLWERFRWMAVIPCLAGMLALGWGLSIRHPDGGGSSAAIQERTAIWLDTLDGLTWAGRGPGSFYMLYPQFAKRTDTMATRPEDPHNEFLNLAFNYGLGSIPVLALLALGFFGSGQERYILVGWLAIAFFSFPTKIPTEGFVGMVALGRLCSSRNWVWLVELGRRSIIPAWAGSIRCADRALEPLYPHKGRV